MKKTILAIALLAAAFGAQATKPTATPAPVAAAAPAPAATNQATVSVTGASTVPGAPLLLSLDGSKPIDPPFQVLFEAGQTNPKWAVTHVTTVGEKSRMFLKSASSHATLEMDVATVLVEGLKIKKDAVIDVESQTSGQAALIKFMKGKTPLGFLVNQNAMVH